MAVGEISRTWEEADQLLRWHAIYSREECVDSLLQGAAMERLCVGALTDDRSDSEQDQ